MQATHDDDQIKQGQHSVGEGQAEQDGERGMWAEKLRQHAEIEDQHLRVRDVGQKALSPTR